MSKKSKKIKTNKNTTITVKNNNQEFFKGDRSETIHSFTVMPKDLNFGGRLFGGKIMFECDLAGVKVVRRALYNLSREVEGITFVTIAMDKVVFKKPGYKGDLISFKSRIQKIGKSSIDVLVKVQRESLKGKVEEICLATLTFVVLKDDKPYPHNLVLGELKET